MLSMSSCSDFLDAKNKSNISADSYFNTEDGLQALRIAAYDEFTSIVPQTDIYECGTDLYMNVRSKEESVFTLYTMTPETSDVSSFYSNAYDLINHANCCIKYGENNAQITAEAIFMRCYGYYLLTQMFGAVPYVTWYIEDANREYPRTPLEEIYPALIEDLEGIMNDSSLPANSITSYGNSGYISQRAVKALLARVCLAAGWDLGTTLTDAASGGYTTTSTEYFTKAAQYAVAAIDGQELTMSFEDKWSALNQDNDEEIFSIQYDRANYPGDESSGGHSLENSYGGYMGDQTVTGLKQVGSNLALSDKAVYLWDEGDERWDGSFMNTIYNYDGENWGTTGYFAYYNVADKSKLPIALRFFPWYESQDDAEAELEAHKAQYIQGDNVVVPQAFILGSTTVKYTFDETTGAVASKDATQNYDYWTTMQYFPTVLKKYDDAETSQTTSKSNDYRDVVVFHVSEMYLVAAEAYLMAGEKANALTYLNKVRARAGAPSIGDFTSYESQFVNYTPPSTFGTFKDIDVILDESAREMFGERVRWMDLRRTRQLVRYNVAFNSNISSISDMSNMAGEVKWYRPIPASEISGNDSMTDADQNPGY